MGSTGGGGDVGRSGIVSLIKAAELGLGLSMLFPHRDLLLDKIKMSYIRILCVTTLSLVFLWFTWDTCDCRMELAGMGVFFSYLMLRCPINTTC